MKSEISNHHIYTTGKTIELMTPTNWKRCERNKDIFNRKVKKDLQRLWKRYNIHINKNIMFRK